MQFSIKQIVNLHVNDEKHIIKDEELQFAMIGAEVEKIENRRKFVTQEFETALVKRRSRVTTEINARSY